MIRLPTIAFMKWFLFSFVFAPVVLLATIAIEGRVQSVDREGKTLGVTILKADGAEFRQGELRTFRAGRGDLEIGYEGRAIRANAVFYNESWYIEQVFPVDGEGAREVRLVNTILRAQTESMKRGKFLREGDPIPDFGMIDEDGEFIRIKELRGTPFVINFIFTRCAAAEMCPASSAKMEQLQEAARADGLDKLHFVTISFDPPFDSPGILRGYAQGYGFELENFHLLTMTQEVVDDLLRQFGILTIHEDGTINHTIATLLVDAGGKIAFRQEGPSWKVEDFLEAAKQL